MSPPFMHRGEKWAYKDKFIKYNIGIIIRYIICQQQLYIALLHPKEMSSSRWTFFGIFVQKELLIIYGTQAGGLTVPAISYTHLLY